MENGQKQFLINDIPNIITTLNKNLKAAKKIIEKYGLQESQNDFLRKIATNLTTVDKTLQALEETLTNEYTPLLNELNSLKDYKIKGNSFISFGDKSIFKRLDLSDPDHNCEVSNEIISILNKLISLIEFRKKENLDIIQLSHTNSHTLEKTEPTDNVKQKTNIQLNSFNRFLYASLRFFKLIKHIPKEERKERFSLFPGNNN